MYNIDVCGEAGSCFFTQGGTLLNKYIAAVDPGKDKCGVAVLDMSGGIIYREVVMTDDLINILQSKKDVESFNAFMNKVLFSS